MGRYCIILFLISSIIFEYITRSSCIQFRIVGGVDVDIQDYPYQVSIYTTSGYWCGGSIITNYYVLTAARCVILSSTPLTVRAGSSYKNKGGTIHQVDWNITHENWKNGNDIAVLRVKQPFIFGKTRQFIEMYNPDDNIIGGTFCNVTGWGMTSENAITEPEQLQAITIRVVDKWFCNAIYVKTTVGNITKGQICAGLVGTGGKDFCYGDTGSPLVIKKKIYGIASFGIGCGRKKFPGIYANVGYLSQWVRQHIIIKV